MNKQILSPFDCDMCAMVEELTKQVVKVEAAPENIRISWEQPRCERNSLDDQRNRAIEQAVNGRLGKRVIAWEYRDGRKNVWIEYDTEQYPEEYRTRLAAIDPKAGSRFCRTLKEVDAIQVRRDNREELERFTGGGTMTIPRTPDGRAVYSFDNGNGVFVDVPEYFYIIRDDTGRYEVWNKQAFDAEFEPKGALLATHTYKFNVNLELCENKDYKVMSTKTCNDCPYFINKNVDGIGYCETFKSKQSTGMFACNRHPNKDNADE